MSLADDLREPVPEAELTRRRFLLAVGTGALAAAGLGTLVTGIEFMKPNVLFEPPTRFPIGRPDEIQEGSVLALPKQKLFVVRERGACYAMSAVCTHLGCIVQKRQQAARDAGFFCPCHGSAFDLAGRVTGGPAPRPLDRLEVTLQRGRLVVDVRKKVPHGTVVTL